MLKKDFRITKTKEFDLIMTKGTVVYSPILLIKYLKNDLKISRFGIIVSNKVSKKASQRNLIKRRLREIVRLNLAKIKKGLDLVIVASPKIINKEQKVLNYQEIEENLINSLKKAKFL